jgi:hypothetical protein
MNFAGRIFYYVGLWHVVIDMSQRFCRHQTDPILETSISEEVGIKNNGFFEK